MARLLSVNVGLPRDIEWKGRIVHTGIWKNPVHGRCRVGSAHFEITQPRVTCYRVGIRTDEPRMPALLTSRERPGFYFRVLSEGMVGAGDEIVKTFGVAPAQIHTEVFNGGEPLTPGVVGASARAPHLPDDDANTGLLVSFARSGIAAHWKASAYQSILELAEACDVPVRWSCRTGVCHNCESGLVSGAVAYELEPLDKPARGNLLICCSRPVRDIVIDL